MSDPVNHPDHYIDPSGVECLMIVRHCNFNIGNVIKYVFRHKLKGRPLQDLEKALFYLDDEISTRMSGIGYVTLPTEAKHALETLADTRPSNEKWFFKGLAEDKLPAAKFYLEALIHDAKSLDVEKTESNIEFKKQLLAVIDEFRAFNVDHEPYAYNIIGFGEWLDDVVRGKIK